MSSWLVCSSPDRVVWVRALTGDIVLCSWARHFTVTVPLSALWPWHTNGGTGEFNAGGSPAID